jgi:hypothetical protein
MVDDRGDLPGRDTLEIRFGDRVHQGLLDPGVPSKDPGLKRSPSELRSGEDEIAIPGDECSIASTIPMRSPSRCSLMTVGAGLLERFMLHHQVQEPGDDGTHPF